ncbi:MAG: hypothetical protein ACRCZP_10730, partial [Phycicoccus sp.]
MDLSRRRAAAGLIALALGCVPGAAWAASAGSTVEPPPALSALTAEGDDRNGSPPVGRHGGAGFHGASAPGGDQPAPEPSAVDHGSERFQPGYLGGRVVVYQPGAPVAGAPVYPLYQVRYPYGWSQRTARPLCN